MTSLQETLPILDQAVPALPGKVSAVAREALGFEKAARDAVAAFQSRRTAADGLIEEVQRALEALCDHAGGHRARVDDAVRELRERAEGDAQAMDDGAGALRAAGEQSASGLESLRTQLAQGCGRTRAAHEQTLAALETLDDHTERAQAGLQHAVEQVTAAIGGARSAIDEGEASVVEGVNALAGAFKALVERVHDRLQRTLSRLDQLGDEQEAEIVDVVTQLESGRQEIEQGAAACLEDLVSDGIEELEAVATALTGLAADLGPVQSDLQGGREGLEAQLQGIGNRIDPLQGSVAQVKQAADEVGLQWP